MRPPTSHKGYTLIARYLEGQGYDRDDVGAVLWTFHLMRRSGYRFRPDGGIANLEYDHFTGYLVGLRPAFLEHPEFATLLQEVARLWVEGRWDHIRYRFMSLGQSLREHTSEERPS